MRRTGKTTWWRNALWTTCWQTNSPTNQLSNNPTRWQFNSPTLQLADKPTRRNWWTFWHMPKCSGLSVVTLLLTVSCGFFWSSGAQTNFHCLFHSNYRFTCFSFRWSTYFLTGSCGYFWLRKGFRRNSDTRPSLTHDRVTLVDVVSSARQTSAEWVTKSVGSSSRATKTKFDLLVRPS